MTTSSHPNSSSIPNIPKVVLNPTPISFAPPRTDAFMGTANPNTSVPVGETDSAKKAKRGKKHKSSESPSVSTESKKVKKPKTNEESPSGYTESKWVRKPKSEDVASVSSESKRPDWLPEGWEIREHIREGGKSAGSKDKYYIEPGTGKRFRSLIEVRRYLGLDDTPKPSEKKNNSSQAKSDGVISSNRKENKKGKADKETTINGEENKKSKVEAAKIIADQTEKKPEKV